jgi:hypothetical protein
VWRRSAHDEREFVASRSAWKAWAKKGSWGDVMILIMTTAFVLIFFHAQFMLAQA